MYKINNIRLKLEHISIMIEINKIRSVYMNYILCIYCFIYLLKIITKIYKLEKINLVITRIDDLSK